MMCLDLRHFLNKHNWYVYRHNKDIMNKNSQTVLDTMLSSQWKTNKARNRMHEKINIRVVPRGTRQVPGNINLFILHPLNQPSKFYEMKLVSPFFISSHNSILFFANDCRNYNYMYFGYRILYCKNTKYMFNCVSYEWRKNYIWKLF